MSSNCPSFLLLKEKSRRGRLVDLREKVKDILSNRLHAHFTDHSVAHSDRVVELAGQLAKPLKQKLNNDEAFVLFAACYLHDIGMHYELAGTMGSDVLPAK